MIQTEYKKGVTVPFYDKAISELLELQAFDGGGKTMVIALANMEQRVYRHIMTVGMREYINVTTMLEEIGFIDQMKDQPAGYKGLDGLFVPTDEVETLRGVSFDSTPQKTVLDDLNDADAELAVLAETEREQLILSRLGQGEYRNKLVEYWNGCAVTDCTFVPLLRASHIKPWRDCNGTERHDVYNGLLLAPHIDAAFDVGLISFDDAGKILISSSFPSQDAYSLRITPKLKIRTSMLTTKHREYLEYHRMHVFRNAE